MAVTPLKVLLFLFGCTAAAGAVAYGTGALDPMLGRGGGAPAAVAALPGESPSDPAAPKGERMAEPSLDEPGGQMMAAVPPATMGVEQPADQQATPPAGPQPPTFDVVRAEADGSLVVAGKAMADAIVELLDGEKVLGSDRATSEGDFAIVLDERLKPGDYQLTLRATPAGEAAIASVETAVLSIPDKPDGQVLAMVEQPGEASSILTMPEAPVGDEKKPAEVASAPAQDVPEAKEAPATDAGATDEAAAEEPQPEDKPADVAEAPADAAKTQAAASEAAPEEKPAGEAATASGEPTPPPQADEAPAKARVTVEAVEIDGGKIFVAGVGDPGHFVRIYANETVLGEAQTDQGGRFLVEAARDLPVGEYVIRADLLDAGGLKVGARAAVPFEREPGESIAAVAPTAEQPADIAKPDEAAAGAGEASPPVGSQAEAPPEQPAVAQPDQPAVASTEPAPTDASPPADAAETPAPAETPPTVATAETSEPPAPVDQADAPAGEAQMEPSETPPTVAKVETEEPPAAAEQPAAAAEASQQPPASGTEVAAAPPETVSPKLEKVEGAVIIRRKDTLWQISRRVYGRGIRYWTIYLANQNQITDPDRIWPGQVFRVPEKSKEGETADMSAMGSQVTTVPKAE